MLATAISSRSSHPGKRIALFWLSRLPERIVCQVNKWELRKTLSKVLQKVLSHERFQKGLLHQCVNFRLPSGVSATLPGQSFSRESPREVRELHFVGQGEQDLPMGGALRHRAYLESAHPATRHLHQSKTNKPFVRLLS